jgi:hypothetical protein
MTDEEAAEWEAFRSRKAPTNGHSRTPV